MLERGDSHPMMPHVTDGGRGMVDAVILEGLKALRPPRRLNLSEWADEYFYLSAESAAEPGRWHTLPYQRGIMNAITDPSITQVSVMKSARIGYTKCMNATIGYYMHQDPCPIMVVQPTIEDAQGYSKEEIAPMLRDCPALAAIVPESKTRDSENTILLKRFPGGALSVVGANSPRGFRRVSRKVVIFDETDGYPPSAGDEGDQIQLGIKRTEYYWDRKIIAGSTPTISGASRIERLFAAGDQRRYYVPCPHCAMMQVLVFPQFRWPKDKPLDAVYVCIECGAEIDHQHKRQMVESGEWRPAPHPQFPDDPEPPAPAGHASFHLWAAYSFSPNATWGQLCSEFVEADRQGPEHLKTFVNTGLGETWKERGEAPDWQRLYERREIYTIGTCPMGVRLLTAGVDVQKDRLVYEVVGWGRDKRSWSIDAGILPGDTSDATGKGPWPALEALLAKHYPHEGGVDLPIAVMAVDSGYNTQVVYTWCKQHPMSRVKAVRGVPTAHVLIGLPSKVDVASSGRKLKSGYMVWPVASHIAKSELYGWLALVAPTDAARADGEPEKPGYCHFPEYDEEYFKQLTAEQMLQRKDSKGFPTYLWALLPGRQNHFLDARVYARAAASVAGLDRLREADWKVLDHRVGAEEVPAAVPAESQPQVAPPVQHAPVVPKRSGWLPRRESWLKGRN